VRFGTESVPFLDLRHVPGRCKFLALMPQWDFLQFFAERARAFPSFRLEMGVEAIDLLRVGDRVTGVVAQTRDGPLEIRADLVVAADGRRSKLRERADLPVRDIGAPIDVLWMRLSKRAGDPDQAFGNVGAGGLLVAIDRREYYQCGFVIRKGHFDDIREAGLPAFREQIARLAPLFADRVAELSSWEDVKLLTVSVNRLREWYLPGLLCIGDAAHAMSPVGGVGINLAIADAVAAANTIAAPLRGERLTTRQLESVQRRREFPTQLTQALQVFIQERLLRRVLETKKALPPPLAIRIFGAIPFLRRIPARIIGVGFLPEHVRSPAQPIP
jgi:2-polyprenyl-6-methoxyphenol hydroxylase-like FAD-dependent oxidoreductase